MLSRLRRFCANPASSPDSFSRGVAPGGSEHRSPRRQHNAEPPGLRTRIRILWNYGGIRVLAASVVRRCLRPLVRWQTMVVTERDLSLPVPEVRLRIPAEIRFLSRLEISRFRPVFEDQGLTWTMIRRRLDRGDLCVGGLSGDVLLYFIWVTFTEAWIPEFRASFLLKAREVYAYNAVTLPEVRGNYLHPAGTAFVMREARARGCRLYLDYIHTDNLSSRRAAVKIPRRWPVRIRRVEFAGLPGALLLGVGSRCYRRLSFPASTGTRRLGRIALWIRGESDQEPAGVRFPRTRSGHGGKESPRPEIAPQAGKVVSVAARADSAAPAPPAAFSPPDPEGT